MTGKDAAFDVSGRVVIITGATSGLGTWLAEGLDAAGARLVLTGRRKERLDAVATRCADAVAVPGDLLSDETRQQCVDAALERYGRLDGLVNNAGVLNAIPALQETADDIRAMLEINLVAPMDLARRCVLAMRARRRRLDRERHVDVGRGGYRGYRPERRVLRCQGGVGAHDARAGRAMGALRGPRQCRSPRHVPHRDDRRAVDPA